MSIETKNNHTYGTFPRVLHSISKMQGTCKTIFYIQERKLLLLFWSGVLLLYQQNRPQPLTLASITSIMLPQYVALAWALFPFQHTKILEIDFSLVPDIQASPKGFYIHQNLLAYHKSHHIRA